MKSSIEQLSKSKCKYLKALRHKKYRRRENLFIAEGMNALEASLRSSLYPLVEVVLNGRQAEILRGCPLAARLPETIPVMEASDRDIASLSTEETPQGILAVCRMRFFDSSDLPIRPNGPLLYIDGVSDPGNLGTVIRTAAWFGLTEILLAPESVDPFNGKVLRASAGSFFTVKIIPIEQAELKAFAAHKRLPMIATAPTGGNAPSSLRGNKPSILILGHEVAGVTADLLASADSLVSIPGSGAVESLNLAAAASIILYEMTQSG
ncbi:MAG: RNA methyltransferase [Deltaproteobacteria bacterium]|nr:RNA methyltransferase [Deltaproteobacteria bacterium]